MQRTYLDHNATTALRLEAREAMIEAMDVLGNPSSVHYEGRAARALMEKSRAQLAESCGAAPDEIIFTSGASEAASMGLSRGALSGGALNGAKGGIIRCAGIEHPSVLAHCEASIPLENGLVGEKGEDVARQLANSETGIIQRKALPVYFEDAVQGFGKIPYAFSWRRAAMGAISAHKIGGPKGVGALLIRPEIDIEPLIRGGGQEGSMRAGTENLIGIVGFADAARAAQRELENGAWEQVRELRDELEEMLLNDCSDMKIAGKENDRLPNTSYMICPGWRGETQVIQMDLAGFAVSAGAACSSGKINISQTLIAMGYSDEEARSGLRISLGPGNTRKEIEAFARAWLAHYRKWRNRAA